MQRYRTFQAHPPLSECISICVSPDGQRLAVGGSDACCSVWNISDMMCTKMIDRMDYPVQTVSFSKCSNMLAIGSEDTGIDIGWIGGGINEK
jgi:THO complex subunit 3